MISVYLSHLTADELIRAHEATGCLLGLSARLDPDLAIKLDTLRADLMAAIEDLDPAGCIGERAQ